MAPYGLRALRNWPEACEQESLERGARACASIASLMRSRGPARIRLCNPSKGHSVQMTSREIVERSLRFACPERIPMTLPEPYPNDVVVAGISRPDDPEIGVWHLVDGKWRLRDEWGNIWGRLEGFSSGEVIHGAIEDDWSLLDSYRWPAIDAPERYREARERFAAHQDKYCLGFLPGFPFAIARYMRRMENFLADVLLEPGRVQTLLERISELLASCIQRFAEAGAHGVFFCEDWGTQERLLVSPATWRRLFRPGFVALCEEASKYGLTVWMHSCGHVYEIIPDLIEVGIRVLQFDQPELHGIDNLARDFGGKVNFWCPVDIQRTLQSRDPDRIEAAARDMILKLGSYGGGFIAGYYSGNEAIGIDPAIQDIACRAFVKYARAVACQPEDSPCLRLT